MDCESMATYLADSMLGTCRRPLCLIFLGCGGAEDEKHLVRALRRLFAIKRVCLMDRTFSTAMNLNAAAIETEHSVEVVRCTSYADLMSMLALQADDMFVIPLGLNNCVQFSTADELWDAYRFFTMFDGMVRTFAPHMARSYVNFLDNKSGIYNSHAHDELTADISVAKRDWWRQACDLITCNGARSILTHTETARTLQG
jgi:hypothetical protein